MAVKTCIKRFAGIVLQMFGETILQIAVVVVQKSPALDEVDKHQAVEHQRGVLFASICSPSPLRILEICTIRPELGVEVARDFLRVAYKNFLHFANDIGDG